MIVCGKRLAIPSFLFVLLFPPFSNIPILSLLLFVFVFVSMSHLGAFRKPLDARRNPRARFHL